MSTTKNNAPNALETYTLLTHLLHPPQPSRLEIDILPSSFPPIIHHEGTSIGIPKPLLVQCYLIARQRFFRPRNTHEPPDTAQEEQTLHATSILLLFDPAHITALNWRKRHLLSLPQTPPTGTPPTTPPIPPTPPSPLQTLQADLTLLTTLLTSPLPKHAKASTLWSHRLFLLQHIPPLPSHNTHPSPSYPRENRSDDALWREELQIVLAAGERHPRNFHAFNYARLLFTWLYPRPSGLGLASRRGVLGGTVRAVHEWCLLHPRDISGWAFVAFLLREMREGGRGDANVDADVEVRRVVEETGEWVRKYEWRGGSVEWFLKYAE